MNLMAELNANAKGYKLVSNGGGDSCYLWCEQYLNCSIVQVSKAENMVPKEYERSCNINNWNNCWEEMFNH
jgi:hypothetical protein